MDKDTLIAKCEKDATTSNTLADEKLKICKDSWSTEVTDLKKTAESLAASTLKTKVELETNLATQTGNFSACSKDLSTCTSSRVISQKSMIEDQDKLLKQLEEATTSEVKKYARYPKMDKDQKAKFDTILSAKSDVVSKRDSAEKSLVGYSTMKLDSKILFNSKLLHYKLVRHLACSDAFVQVCLDVDALRLNQEKDREKDSYYTMSPTDRQALDIKLED